MHRLSLCVALFSLLAVSACEPEAEITGACLYAGDASLDPACMNLWDGDESCLDEGGMEGSFEEGAACSELGYPYPCTADHPQSLWLEDEAGCAAWDAAG